MATDTDLTIPADIDVISFEAAYVQGADRQVVPSLTDLRPRRGRILAKACLSAILNRFGLVDRGPGGSGYLRGGGQVRPSAEPLACLIFDCVATHPFGPGVCASGHARRRQPCHGRTGPSRACGWGGWLRGSASGGDGPLSAALRTPPPALPPRPAAA